MPLKSLFRFILVLILTFFFYAQLEATIVNQLAFDATNIQSPYPWDLNLESVLNVSCPQLLYHFLS